MKSLFPKLIWGTFMLLAAAFVIVNQLEGFATLGVGGIIAAILAFAVFVQCLAYLYIAPLPIPLAVLYIVFQTSFELPYIKAWTLILAAVLASIGLAIILPNIRRHSYSKDEFPTHKEKHHPKMSQEIGGSDNNPSISVNFGAINRQIYAENLEKVQLYCHFGAMEISINNSTMVSPSGAEIMLNCNGGAIKLQIPKYWRIINQVACTLGAVEIDECFAFPEENAPQLTLNGSVSLGGIEVRGI